jgi:cysteinyl-tRNA synthetase
MKFPDVRDSIVETIGATPLVRLGRTNPHRARGVEVLAKLEGMNPCGSVKERVAASMVEAAERDGRLVPGKVVVESSSGNTGIGLAMVCAARGYGLLITMSAKQSVERRKMLAALGAEIVLTSAAGGSDEAWDRADEIAAKDPDRYVRLCQYHEPSNPAAHYRGTAEEVWRQTGGRVDALVCGLGTTGTIVGAGRRLKELAPGCLVVAVEPVPGHKQEGLRNIHVSRVPSIYDPSAIDRTIACEDADALRLTRALARDEGIFCGVSSGSALFGALEVAGSFAAAGRAGVVVVVFPDRGEKYLSTGVFAEPTRPQDV